MRRQHDGRGANRRSCVRSRRTRWFPSRDGGVQRVDRGRRGSPSPARCRPLAPFRLRTGRESVADARAPLRSLRRRRTNRPVVVSVWRRDRFSPGGCAERGWGMARVKRAGRNGHGGRRKEIVLRVRVRFAAVVHLVNGRLVVSEQHPSQEAPGSMARGQPQLHRSRQPGRREPATGSRRRSQRPSSSPARYDPSADSK